MKEKFKGQKGITLVALVITIIVMLVLVGVILVASVAENGIIDRATTALIENEQAEIEEIVQISKIFKPTASEGVNNTYLDMPATAEALVKNLKAAGFKVITSEGTEAMDGTDIYTEGSNSIDLNVQGKRAEYECTVSKSGSDELKLIEDGTNNSDDSKDDSISDDNNSSFEDILSNLPTKYDEYLQMAKQKGQVTDINIGIGTDGNLVNLDLWHYYKTDDGENMSLGDGEGSNIQPAYDEQNILNGQIQGKFPQYIFAKKENKIYTIIELNSLFGYYKESEGVETIPEIPSTIKVIGDRAFAETKLKNITIPDSVEIIKDYAFSYCKSLETVELSSNLKIIKNEAFSDCVNLKGIVLPSTLERIEDYSFSWCNSLSSINIPEQVEKIGFHAFMDCDNLVKIYIEAKKFDFEIGSSYDSKQFTGLFHDEVESRVLYFENNEALENFKNRYNTIFGTEYDTKYGELKIKE